MGNNDYVYKETAEERALTPKVKKAKNSKLKNFFTQDMKLLAITIIIMYACYRVLLIFGYLVEELLKTF